MNKILILFLLYTNVSFGQNEWKEMSHFPLVDQSVWKADLLGNLYVADKDLIVKYDTAGVQQYYQSIKSKGRIDDILAINTMKIMLFSLQQQTFTIMDNTLSEANQTYDLSEMGFGFATLIAPSSQPNKLWVYDQLNSKLILLDLNRSNQQQDIENVRGLLNSTDIQWMKEEGNQLYLFDGKEKIYLFDLYGSLLEVFDVPGAERVEVSQGEIFILQKGQLFHYRPEDKTLEPLTTPIQGIEQFQWVNNTCFFRVNRELLKYRFYL
ncbi:MAG: hypothetical protein WC044_11960 [Crocinitomicaceae bacterium]